MLLQKAPKGPNSMSIGIAKEGVFKSHGSDGFGLSAYSWGLIESRATGEGKINANRQPVGNGFRKMRENDVFTVVYDESLGKAWLIIYTVSINGSSNGTSSSKRSSPSRHTSSSSSSSSTEAIIDALMNTTNNNTSATTNIELCQEFTLHPPDQPLTGGVVIGATYCNDHELRILNIPPPNFNSTPSQISSSVAAEAPVISSSSLQPPWQPQQQQQRMTAIAAENEENTLLLLPPIPTTSTTNAATTSTAVTASRLTAAAMRNNTTSAIETAVLTTSALSATSAEEDPFYTSAAVAALLQWDISQSDPALRFIKHNSSAHRPGNVSCYPAALVSVPRNCRSSLTAVLENCPFANNTMSFGIALKGFPKSGQQAIGERVDSWGIFNNRSEPCVDELSKIYASGVPVATFRRLRLGDVLQICVDASSSSDNNSSSANSGGTAELRINDTEFRYTFTGLNMRDKDYVVGATFCNNHSLLIINHIHIAQFLNPHAHRLHRHHAVTAATPSSGTATTATTSIKGSSVAVENSINNSVLASSSSLLQQLQLTLPYAQYLEKASVLSVLPASFTPPSAIATANQYNTSSSSSIYDTLHESIKQRIHVIRRYGREADKTMKELKFSLLPPVKQIKAINCALQVSLLPAELHALSSVMAILNLLQSDQYPNFAINYIPAKSHNHNNSSSNTSQEKRHQQRLTSQDLQTLVQSNWREYIPGHILYKQVIPHCMSRASQHVHLLPTSAGTGSASTASGTSRVRVCVEGAVGYTIQLLQPLVIPATHVLRITARVYPYNSALMKASSVSARRKYIEEKQQQQQQRLMMSNSNKKKMKNSSDGDDDSYSDNEEDDDDSDIEFLKPEVLCELYGTGNNSVTPNNQQFSSAGVDISSKNNITVVHKQPAAVCYNILQASATQLNNYTPISYSTSATAASDGESSAGAAVLQPTTVTNKTDTGSSAKMTISTSSKKIHSTTTTATPVTVTATDTKNSSCSFEVGDSVVRRAARNIATAGEIGDVYQVIGPITTITNSSNSSSAASNDVDSNNNTTAESGLRSDINITEGTTVVAGATVPSTIYSSYYEVHVRWRDSNHRQVYTISSCNSTATRTAAVFTVDDDVNDEIVLWKKNPLTQFMQQAPTIVSNNKSSAANTSTDTMPMMMWTPVLTKELEFSLEPFQRSNSNNNSNSSSNDSNHIDDITSTNCCNIQFLVTPILTVSSVIHSPRHYHALQRVVNTFNLLGPQLGMCITGEVGEGNDVGNNMNSTTTIPIINSDTATTTSSHHHEKKNTNNTLVHINNIHKSTTSRRDKIDMALVGLIERVILKLRHQAGSASVTLPDSWERLAVSAEDAVHFPLLSLALTDESHWLQQYCLTTTTTARTVHATSSSSSQPTMTAVNNNIQTNDTTNNLATTAANNNHETDDDDSSGVRELLQGFEQLLKEEEQEISLTSSSQQQPRVSSSVMSSELLAQRYTLIRLLNQELSSCLDLINFNAVSHHIHNTTTSAAGSSSNSNKNTSSSTAVTIAELLSRHRGYIFSWVKEAFISRLINHSVTDPSSATSGSNSTGNTTTTSGNGKFELILSRSRAAKYTAQREIDSHGRWSVFGQAFRRIHGMPASVLRRTGQLWDTVFAGERSHDSGGPYREAWSAIIADLMISPSSSSSSTAHPVLPLLKPCPNNEGKVGLNQETYLLNPDCIHHTTQLEMLSFLGKLMGAAARAHQYLELCLAPLVWKCLVRQPLTMDDIRDVDVNAANQILWLRQRVQGGGSGVTATTGANHQSLHKPSALLTEEIFYAHDLHFSVLSKGGSVIELHPGGAMEPVQWGDDIDRYCDELERYYLHRECQPVAEAVRAGLITQLPNAMLNILRWYELEEMVCGRPDVDIDLLQSTVEYERGCSANDKHVLWLWELLRHEFSQEDKKAFIRFVWGRSRLPLTKAGFSQPFKIQGFARSGSSHSSNNNDSYLPVSHTCFFSIELPRYSNKEHLKKKLLYAIHNCTAIDADDTGAGMRAAALGIEM